MSLHGKEKVYGSISASLYLDYSCLRCPTSAPTVRRPCTCESPTGSSRASSRESSSRARVFGVGEDRQVLQEGPGDRQQVLAAKTISLARRRCSTKSPLTLPKSRSITSAPSCSTGRSSCRYTVSVTWLLV
jgi:hypothetical protein